MNKLAIMNVYSRQDGCKSRFALFVIDAATAGNLRERIREVRAARARDKDISEISWKDNGVAFVADLPPCVPAWVKDRLGEVESVVIDEPRADGLYGADLDWCHMVADLDAVYWRAMCAEVEMWTGFLTLKELQTL